MELQLSGLASGFDWRSMVDQLVDVERTPQKQLLAEQGLIKNRGDVLAKVRSQIGALRTRLTTLNNPELFDARTAASSDSSLATVSAAAGTWLGSYNFTIKQLATASTWKGTGNVGGAISQSDDVSGVILGSAGFSTRITAGTITINNQQIDVQSGESLLSVFDKIQTATGITATYSAETDTVHLTGPDRIVLGSAADTSNLLQALKLQNNGSNTLMSSGALGGVRTDNPLAQSNLATTVSDGGAGEFKINGVSITFNNATDSLGTVLSRINESDAGVLASYDVANDRFVLANKKTGNVGMSLEDVSGNFLTATGLKAGTLVAGQNLVYSLNDGGDLTSQGNTIDGASAGVPGLSLTALGKGSVAVSVSSDSSKVRTALVDFVNEYNMTQGLISQHTASSTDAKGKVTAGLLADDGEINEISRNLRSLMSGTVSGLTGSIRRLEDIGFSGNGQDDLLSTTSLGELDDLLASGSPDLKNLLTNATTGLAARLDSYLEKVIGDDGTLTAHQGSLTTQSANIDKQVDDMERYVTQTKERLIESFVAMETAQQRLNQQLQFLQERFK